jgi:hypothetical protein
LPTITASSYNKLTCDLDMANSKHWIPNTDETPGTFKIKLEKTIANGTVESLAMERVEIFSPSDPNWATDDTGNMNIHRNKGTGISLYAVFGSQLVRIATMQRTRSGFTPTAEVPYYVELHNLAGEDNYLQTNNNGDILYYRENGSSTDTFTVKADGTVLPGDDFYLRFKYEYVISTPQAGDFFATFDKNLLDWANQYVDETIDESGNAITGAEDWNGENQIPLSSWTRFNDGEEVHNAIAYGWGCYDSPADFNSEVGVLDGLSSDVDTWFDYEFPAFKIENNEYVPVEPFHSVPGLTTYARFGNHSLSMNVFKNAEGEPLDADGGVLSGDHNYNSDQTAVSSGTDCSGFVSRCSYLSGTQYKINHRRNNITEDKEGTTHYASDTYSTEITDFNLIVPGDIIVKVGHVALVLDVDFPENIRELGAQHRDWTKIIHSTSSGLEWKVRSDQNWTSLPNDESYVPKRLIIE